MYVCTRIPRGPWKNRGSLTCQIWQGEFLSVQRKWDTVSGSTIYNLLIRKQCTMCIMSSRIPPSPRHTRTMQVMGITLSTSQYTHINLAMQFLSSRHHEPMNLLATMPCQHKCRQIGSTTNPYRLHVCDTITLQKTISSHSTSCKQLMSTFGWRILQLWSYCSNSCVCSEIWYTSISAEVAPCRERCRTIVILFKRETAEGADQPILQVVAGTEKDAQSAYSLPCCPVSGWHR